MRRFSWIIGLMMLSSAMLACTLPPGIPVTPTLAPSSTPSLTPMVPTDTPLPTETSTATGTQTPIPTPTASPTVTASRTFTPSPTATGTPPPTETPSLTPTYTASATATPSDTDTPPPTLVPTETFSPTPSPTSPASLTPTATLSETPPDTEIPTIAVTESPTASDIPTDVPTLEPILPTRVPPPTARRTATPRPTVVSASTAPPNPNGVPISVLSTLTAIARTAAPTAIYYGGSGGSIIRGGVVIATVPPGNLRYEVNPQTGGVALVNQGNLLFVGSKPVVVSPYSTYSPTAGKAPFFVRMLRWSPDGRLLAFIVETPNARSGDMRFEDTINDGVWVYDPGANTSRQVFRNEYRKGTNIQIANNVGWTNDSRLLLITWQSATQPNNLSVVDNGLDINAH